MNPIVMMNVGKGGVGKTTIAVAMALLIAEKGRKVGLIDCDGKKAHSIHKTLHIDSRGLKENEFNETPIFNLFVAMVHGIDFIPIEESKKKKRSIFSYLKQFVADYMLIPLCDMLMTFFGVPTDIEGTSNYLTLVRLYHEAVEKEFDFIVIDVEPTAGFGRLLKNAEVISRSLNNLNKHWLKIKAIAVFWKDIGAYLESDYIRKDIGKYTERMTNLAVAIREAKFAVITIPESNPVDQAFEVVDLIESFGGNVSGFVLNNIRPQEGQTISQIERVVKSAGKKPVIRIIHRQVLCDNEMDGRRNTLREVGGLLEALI